jgi:hypothetical protein
MIDVFLMRTNALSQMSVLRDWLDYYCRLELWVEY